MKKRSMDAYDFIYSYLELNFGMHIDISTTYLECYLIKRKIIENKLSLRWDEVKEKIMNKVDNLQKKISKNSKSYDISLKLYRCVAK